MRIARTRSDGFSFKISSINSLRSMSIVRRIRIALVFVRLPEVSYTGGGEGDRLGSFDMRSASSSTWLIRSVSSRTRTRSWISCTCSKLITPDRIATFNPASHPLTKRNTRLNVATLLVPTRTLQAR